MGSVAAYPGWTHRSDLRRPPQMAAPADQQFRMRSISLQLPSTQLIL
jgi:hypothetical protein